MRATSRGVTGPLIKSERKSNGSSTIEGSNTSCDGQGKNRQW